MSAHPPISPRTRNRRKVLANKTNKLIASEASPMRNKNRKRQHTSYELLDRFNRKTYMNWQKRCLAEREQLGVGKSPQMNTLFRFWSVNLREHFHKAMYSDFRKIALDDANKGESYGLQCLFRFYSYGLEKTFNQNLFDEFQSLALQRFTDAEDTYGLEKLVAFLTFNKGNKPSLLPGIQTLLETKFQTLESFQK